MASSGSFCIMNEMYRGTTSLNDHVLSVGGTRITQSNISGSNHSCGTAGTHLFTSGKFYWEAYIPASQSGASHVAVGILNAGDGATKSGSSIGLGITAGDIGINASDLVVKFSNSQTKDYTESAFTTGDILQVAVDADNGAIYYGKNGTFLGSGDPTSGASKTNAGATWTPSSYAGGWVPSQGHQGGNGGALYMNWGQDSTFGGARSAGGNTDANGFGDFVHSPPSGYLALCSANLPTSTNIDPSETDDDHPVKLCNAVTYTGTGSARTVSGFGFQPDMVWIKNRASPGDQAHRIVDSSRGVSKAMIPEDTQVENTETTAIQAFNSDGFTIGSALGGYNTNTGTYIAWGWKANGGTTSTNTSGTVTTTVQASTAGGFSILTYTGGNGSWGSTNQDTIGHGLSAAPEFMIFKERNATDAWTVFHHSVGAGGGTTAAHNNLRLDTNEALYTNQSYKSFGGVMPTSTVVTIEGNTTNQNTSNHIAYCWHGVEGYSKFGNFEGNNNNNGVFVYTGFRPRIIFIKAIDQAGEWVVYDTARNVDNPVDSVINWDVSSAESANDATRAIDVYGGGFKLRTSNITINNTNTFVFGAWGDVPFKYNNTHIQ